MRIRANAVSIVKVGLMLSARLLRSIDVPGHHS